MDTTALRLVVERKRVTADTVHVRPNHGQHTGHGDRRIHRVAAPAQDVVARGRGEGMARRYRASDTSHVGAIGGREVNVGGP